MSLVDRPLPTSVTTLCCGDHGSNDADVRHLWALMASGLSQPAASRIVWGGVPDLPEPGNAAGWVRRTLAARLPWLGEAGAVSPLLLVAAWVALWVGGCVWAVMGR
jgi:hypothetical protein